MDMLTDLTAIHCIFVIFNLDYHETKWTQNFIIAADCRNMIQNVYILYFPIATICTNFKKYKKGIYASTETLNGGPPLRSSTCLTTAAIYQSTKASTKNSERSSWSPVHEECTARFKKTCQHHLELTDSRTKS